MGRSHWLLKIGHFLCYLAGGMAVFIDAHLSKDWMARATHADKVFPSLSLWLAFVLAVIVSGFGAIVTAPYSWQLIFSSTKKLARIDNDNQRMLAAIGALFLSAFLVAGFVAAYWADMLSTYATVKHWFLTVMIVFSGDICFLLANILGFMCKVSYAHAEEFNAAFEPGVTRTINARSTEID